MNTAIQKLPKYVQEKINTVNLPLKYDVAVRALASCRNIDEAKYYADKAEALAAWAKIYRNDQAKIEAKRLKLHAYRRMGILAQELSGELEYIRPAGRNKGRKPGAVTILKNAGLALHQANVASAVSKLSEKKFKAAVNAPSPPSAHSFTIRLKGASDAWKVVVGYVQGPGPLPTLRCFCRKHKPKLLARGLSVDEGRKAGGMAREVIEWLDTFEQYLPRDSAGGGQR